MEKDFHYYLVYALAKTTGCSNPDVIAFSSQFVDDNNEGQFSIDHVKTSFPEKIKANGAYYYPIMTQSMSISSLRTDLQKYVYVPFHFLPGDNNVEIDGKKNPLCTTPNSQNSQKLLSRALDTKNPYLVGIALHTYADTWSHQNFTGMEEDWNSVRKWYDVFKALTPNIGHADSGHNPDEISETWTDHRFKRKIDNKERAFEATGEIYKTLRRRTQSGPLWKDVRRSFRQIMEAHDYDDRIKMINDFLTENGQGPIPKYDKNYWIDAALDRRNNGAQIVMKAEFKDTHWHKFHLAAKDHFAFVLNLIREI